MKKTVIAFLLVFVMLFCFVSCGKPSTANGAKPKVIATVFPAYDFTRSIAGDKIELKMLVKPGTDVHSFEPSAVDIAAVNDCDFIICTGGASDSWINDIAGVNNKKVVRMVDCVELLSEGEINAREVTEDEKDDGEFDEHVWTSPLNAIEISDTICEKLCKTDGKNAKTYRENCDNYSAKLKALYDEYADKLSTASKPLMVADRFPFLYLTKCFNLDYYAAFTGCSATEDPSPKTVASLVNDVKQNKIDTVFYIEFSSKAVAKSVCGLTGAKAKLLHSCHTVSNKDFESGITYLELMTRNLKAITEAVE